MGSWPAAMTHAVHPHQLVLLRYNRNSCDLCGGHLAGKLGYRCEPCDFDVHCTCLPNNTGTSLTRRTSAQAPPPLHNAHAHAHPPPRVSSPWHAAPGAHAQHHHHDPQPSVIYAPAPAAAAAGRPQLNLSLSLSEQFGHQLGAQTSTVSPAPSNHGYYRPRPDYGAPYPHSYDHLQQQNYQNTNNQRGYDVPDQQSFDYLQQQNYPIAYQHDYTGTRDSGDVDDYDDPLDDMDSDYTGTRDSGDVDDYDDPLDDMDDY